MLVLEINIHKDETILIINTKVMLLSNQSLPLVQKRVDNATIIFI